MCWEKRNADQRREDKVLEVQK